MARGFAYAGVSATVTTLWGVFSHYTGALYASFFGNMADGQPKDLALQKAQIDFLENATDHAQLPVSWAGLVLVGSTTPILPQHNMKLISMCIAMLLALITVCFRGAILAFFRSAW